MQRVCFFITFYILSATLITTAQTTEKDKKLNIKLVKANMYYFHNFKEKKIDLGNISPEVELGRAFKFTHNIELKKLQFNKEEYEKISNRIIVRRNKFDIRLKYQLNYYFLHNKETRVIPYVGSMFTYLFYHEKYTPFIPSTLLTKSWYSGILFGLTAGAKYSIKDKYYFDLSFPVEPVSFKYVQMEVLDPKLTKKERRTGGFDLDVAEGFYCFNYLRIKFGIGLTF